MERYLFICSGGKNRSPGAVYIAKSIAKRRDKVIEADYGAIDIEIPVEKERVAKHFEKYTKVFIMEESMRAKVIQKLGIANDRIINLDVPDNYENGDKALVDILERKIEKFIL
jgi:predicted protein tyrosine phosphatase